MRWLAFLLLALASCEASESEDPTPPERQATADDRVECALHGTTEFRQVCRVDRAVGKDGLLLTIWAPDGGFRRLRVTKDGRGVVAADGAAPAVVTIVGASGIEVAIDGDRYRLPATIK